MNFAHVLGWTLVHSVWEIAGIAILFFLVNLLLRRATANARYIVALAALSACLIAPIGTAFVLAPRHTGAKTTLNTVATVASKADVETKLTPASTVNPVNVPTPKTLVERIDLFLPTIVILWLAGLCIMSFRMLGGLFVVERLKRRASNRVDIIWQELANSVATRLGVNRPINLVMSESVYSPAVVGFFKTVILFPASALTGLSTANVEALLAHELAHVRRYDYAVNFAQSIVETILFYHPASWWLSNVVRTEREHCCDDIALSFLGDRQQYATALMSLEKLRHSMPRLAMAANHGSLLSRIRRIVLPNEQRLVPASTWTTMVLALTISIGLTQTLHAKEQPFVIKRQNVKVGENVPGRVVDVDGHDVAGATVLGARVSYTTGETSPVTEVVSNPKGQVELKRGMQWIAMKPGLGMGFADWSNGKPVIKLLPVKQIHLRLVDISGAPIAGVTVGPQAIMTRSRFERISEESPLFSKFSCKTDADGRATLERIPAMANVSLAITDEQYAIKDRTASIKPSIKDGEIPVVLVPAGSIEGVVSSDGKPMPNTSVFARSDADLNRELAFTDANGKFTLKHLPVGGVLLQARTWYVFNRPYANPEMHASVSRDSVQHVEIKIGTGIPLHVHVLSRSGHPLADLDVKVTHANNQGFPEAGGPTDKNGSIICMVQPGPVTVSLEQWTEVVNQPLTIQEGAFNTITLQAPIDEKDEKIVCRLTDADGKQVGATSVVIECTDFHNKRTELRYVTDQFGKAIFTIPVSRVKTITAHAKSGNQISDPKVRPVNGVITLKLHRMTASEIAKNPGRALG